MDLCDQELLELLCVCVASNPWHGSSQLEPHHVAALSEMQEGMHTDTLTEIIESIQQYEEDQKSLMVEREGIISKVVLDKWLHRLQQMPSMRQENFVVNFLRTADYMNAEGYRLITVAEYRTGIAQMEEGKTSSVPLWCLLDSEELVQLKSKRQKPRGPSAEIVAVPDVVDTSVMSAFAADSGQSEPSVRLRAADEVQADGCVDEDGMSGCDPVYTVSSTATTHPWPQDPSYGGHVHHG